MMADGQQFAVTLERSTNGVAVVILAGEVDLYTAPQFREVLLQTIDDGAVRVVIDLTDVSFIDSTALGVLVSAGKRLQQSAGRLAIGCPDEKIRRILEITGLDTVFAVFPTRDAAVAAQQS
jgi:anti-sigma B factor antagonist